MGQLKRDKRRAFVKGLGDLGKELGDTLDDLVDEFVEGLGENELFVVGLVLGRGIFPTGVVVEAGIFCSVSIDVFLLMC